MSIRTAIEHIKELQSVSGSTAKLDILRKYSDDEDFRLCSEFSVNAYPHGKTVHILRSSEPEAEAEPPPLAAHSVLDRLA